MKNKQGAIRIEGIIIGILGVGLIMVTLLGMASEMGDKYGVVLDTGNYSDTFDAIEETQNLSQQVSENIKGSNFESVQGVLAIPKSGIGAMKLTTQGLGTYSTMLNQVANEFGISPTAVSTIIAAFVLIVMFSLLAYWGYRSR